MSTSNAGFGFPLSNHITRDYTIIQWRAKAEWRGLFSGATARRTPSCSSEGAKRACSEDPEITKRFENEAASAGAFITQRRDDLREPRD